MSFQQNKLTQKNVWTMWGKGQRFCGVLGWRSRAKGKAVLPFDIWLHILVILFYNHVGYVGAMPCPRKSQKELYTRKDLNK